MIGKKGYIATVKVDTLKKVVGGIELPEKRNAENFEFIVAGFGFDTVSDCISIGDHVIFDRDPSTAVNIGFEGHEIMFHKIDNAVAIVDHEDFSIFDENQKPLISDFSEKDKAVKAVGDKIVIKRSIVNGFYKVGDLFVPYERRELGRAHNGIIISISESCSEKTGFKKGMHVIYDYNASFGHENPFDIVKEENVFCALTKHEYETIASRN